MKLDKVKKLHQKKYRAEFGHYLLEGEHLILELVKASERQPHLLKSILYVTPEYVQWAHDLPISFNVIELTTKQMNNISDTKTPPGIIACVPIASTDQLTTDTTSSKDRQRYVYLHEVQDPGNLGTIIRTLAWFGDTTLLLSPNSVDPFNAKVVRASMGALFYVPIEQEISLAQLNERFDKFAYLDMNGESIAATSFKTMPCYIFGNEARGVPRDALAQMPATAFTIKGAGNIESLNLASAVNMCMYELMGR